MGDYTKFFETKTWSKDAKKGKICQKFGTSSDDFLLNHVKEPKSGIYNYFIHL